MSAGHGAEHHGGDHGHDAHHGAEHHGGDHGKKGGGLGDYAKRPVRAFLSDVFLGPLRMPKEAKWLSAKDLAEMAAKPADELTLAQIRKFIDSLAPKEGKGGGSHH